MKESDELNKKMEELKGALANWQPEPPFAPATLLGHVKADVSEILLTALNGSDASLRYDGNFIRWGLVEKRIHAAIEAKWPNSVISNAVAKTNDAKALE